MADQRIRPASLADVDVIGRIASETWNAAYEGILEEATIDAAIEAWYDAGTLRERVSDDGSAFLLAVRDDAVVGYVNGGREEGDGVHLGSIYVLPDHWGTGVGSALFAEFERWCLVRSYEHVAAIVLAENELARGFYRDHGFELVSERDADVFGERVRECNLRKRLEVGSQP